MKKTSDTGSACSQKALKISAKARYALRFVMDVAAHSADDKPRTGAVIAAAQNISEKFLSRIVIPLREKGIVRSIRGNVGGFRLARNPEDITLLDIVETMQGPVAILDCLAPGSDCPRLRSCLARRVWKDVNQSLVNALTKITVATILKRDSNIAETLDFCI